MPREKRRKKKGGAEEIETTIDPYTGEEQPVPEDADQFIEVVLEETDDRRGSNYLLNEESSMDSYATDAVSEQSAHYTEDEYVEEDFDDRQDLAISGRRELLAELDEHHSLSPEITAGDVDASWQTANAAGEEALGGSAPTPDQDIVDNLGAAAGLTYNDDEPLDYHRKVLDRDRNRWEMNPASADQESEEEEDAILEDIEDLEEEDDQDEEEDEEDDEGLEDEEELEDDVDDEDDEDLEELGYQIEDDED